MVSSTAAALFAMLFSVLSFCFEAGADVCGSSEGMTCDGQLCGSARATQMRAPKDNMASQMGFRSNPG